MPTDFQEFLLTRLLTLCDKAQFLHTPLEHEQVPKETSQCSNSVYQHFQIKPVLHFTFPPENVPAVRNFINHLDTYATEYDMEESQNFHSYPITHDLKHKTILQLGGTCSCDPVKIRNQYLDNWAMNYYENSDQWRRTLG